MELREVLSLSSHETAPPVEPRRPHVTDLISPELTAEPLADQPYAYHRAELVEPDWTRLPGWKDVTADEWRSVQWQRSHCVKNVKQLRDVMGYLLEDRVYDDLERDQAERATMSM